MKPRAPLEGLNGILTRDEVAAWLNVEPRELGRLCPFHT